MIEHKVGLQYLNSNYHWFELLAEIVMIPFTGAKFKTFLRVVVLMCADITIWIEKYELFSENPEDLKLIYQKLTTAMEKLEMCSSWNKPAERPGKPGYTHVVVVIAVWVIHQILSKCGNWLNSTKRRDERCLGITDIRYGISVDSPFGGITRRRNCILWDQWHSLAGSVHRSAGNAVVIVQETARVVTLGPLNPIIIWGNFWRLYVLIHPPMTTMASFHRIISIRPLTALFCFSFRQLTTTDWTMLPHCWI